MTKNQKLVNLFRSNSNFLKEYDKSDCHLFPGSNQNFSTLEEYGFDTFTRNNGAAKFDITKYSRSITIFLKREVHRSKGTILMDDGIFYNQSDVFFISWCDITGIKYENHDIIIQCDEDVFYIPLYDIVKVKKDTEKDTIGPKLVNLFKLLIRQAKIEEEERLEEERHKEEEKKRKEEEKKRKEEERKRKEEEKKREEAERKRKEEEEKMEAIAHDPVAYFEYRVKKLSLTQIQDNLFYPAPKQFSLLLKSYAHYYHVPQSETILIARDTSFANNLSQGLVVTDVGMYHIRDNERPDEAYYFDWKDVSEVNSIRGYIIFSGTSNKGAFEYSISETSFIKGDYDNKYTDMLADIFQHLADLAGSPQDMQELVDQIAESIDNKDFDKANDLCEELLAIAPAEALYWSAKTKYSEEDSIVLDDYSEEKQNEVREYCDSLLKDAMKNIDTCLEILNEEERYMDYDFAQNLKGRLLQKTQGNSIARRWFIKAMGTDNSSAREEAIAGYKDCTDTLFSVYFDDFLSIEDSIKKWRKDDDSITDDDAQFLIEESNNNRFTKKVRFDERQFIFFVKNIENIAGCYDKDENINWVFTLDRYPKDIEFPVGHPIANTLYIAHPAKEGLYLPYEDAENLIFHDKVEDFCRLSQCLGATQITFSSIQGESISQTTINNFNVNVDGGVKKISGQTSVGISKNNSNNTQRSKEVGLSFSYNPTKKPYCPDDIQWLESDTSWEKFVKQRLEGNILSYSKRFSSSETTNVTSSRKIEVKSSFENLMVNINSNFDSSKDKTFCSSESTIWEISVQFKSIDDFDDNATIPQIAGPSLQLSTSEEQYKEEFLFFIEDGEIGESERHLLERKRKKLGISEERAKQIEDSCMPSFSEEEKEYIEIYKEMIAQGEISERLRKILNREAESLGISAVRMAELESNV